MPFGHAGNQDVESSIQEQNRLAQTLQDQLRRKRTTRHKYLDRKWTAAKYLVGDCVLVHRDRFQGRTAAENENTLFYGLYLVTGVTGGGITACCSPTLGVEVNVAHKYLKQWPFSLSVNPDSESDEFGAEAAKEDEELEAEETDQRDVRDEMGQSLPVYGGATRGRSGKETKKKTNNNHKQGNPSQEGAEQAKSEAGTAKGKVRRTKTRPGTHTHTRARTPPHPQPVGSGPRQPAQRAGNRGWESARPRTPDTQARGAPPGRPRAAPTARKASSEERALWGW